MPLRSICVVWRRLPALQKAFCNREKQGLEMRLIGMTGRKAAESRSGVFCLREFPVCGDVMERKEVREYWRLI